MCANCRRLKTSKIKNLKLRMLSKITGNKLFNLGDIVRCKKNNPKDAGIIPGLGYKLDLTFKIVKIINAKPPIYFPARNCGIDGCGVYEPWLELVESKYEQQRKKQRAKKPR